MGKVGTEETLATRMSEATGQALLEKMGKHGIDAGNDNICKAAYYAASQQLFLTCYEPVPGADVSRAAEYVAKCVDACDKSRNDDLYYLAALRLTALIAARDCRFADAAELCRMTLDRCSEYKGETIRRNFGSLHSIAGDMNLLLGVLHYRASKLRDCIRYFEDAFTSFQEDSLGKAMWCVGYAEAETEILFMSAAEKCALAEKYIGLARFSQKDAYPLDQCVGIMDAGVNLLETVGWNDPFFLISASSDYNILSQMCERGGDKEQAAKFDELSKSRGVEALTNLERIVSDGEKKQKYFEKIQSFRRIALRLGLLELYGDYTRFEILMSQPPFSDMDHIHLARLNFDMGEYSRVVGRNESAVDYFNEVRRHSFDSEGNPFYIAAEFRYDKSLSKEENMELALAFMREVKRGDYFQMSADYQYGKGAHSAIMISDYDPETDTVHWMDSNMRGGKHADGLRYGLVQYDEVKEIRWWAEAFCKKKRGATIYRLRDDIIFAE